MTLSRERVVDTAIDILTRFGLADLSMRRLASELAVQPGALYWHVPSKQALLVEVAHRLLAPIRPEQGATLQEALRSQAHAIRDALLPVPDGADVAAVAFALDPKSVPALHALGEIPAAYDVGPEMCDAVRDLIVHHVLGSVATTQFQRQAGAESSGTQRTFEHGLQIILDGIAAH